MIQRKSTWVSIIVDPKLTALVQLALRTAGFPGKVCRQHYLKE